MCDGSTVITGGPTAALTTVNVEIFAQYIFSRISHKVLDGQKFNMSEKINHYRAIELTTICAKISPREIAT